MVGKEKAKFTDAVWIVAIGIIIGSMLGVFIHGLLGFAASLILWLTLIRHFFDTGWLKALVIAVIALVVFAIIAAVLAFIGLLALSRFI
jgi:ABC-type antimicrobial peptide transport system permease subunit